MARLLTLKLAFLSFFHPCLAADNLSISQFDSIPVELHRIIYSYLTYEDLALTSRVNKHHHQLTQERCQELHEVVLSPSMISKPFPVYHLKSIVDTVDLTDVSAWTSEKLHHLIVFKETGLLLFDGFLKGSEKERVNFSTLSSVIKKLPKLTQLSLHSLQLTNDDITHLLPGLPFIPALSFFSCDIQFEALETLLTNIPPSLRELSFGGDMMGSLNIQSREDWQDAEKLLENPGAVNFVYLDRNIHHLTHLQTLDLYYNPFPPSCLYFLVKRLRSLTEKPHWESLHLQKTYIQANSLPLLKELVKLLPHLTMLNLEGTPFYENKEGVKALEQVRPTLKLNRVN